MTSASASGTPSVPFSPEHHFFRGREGGGVIKPGKGGRDRGRQSGGEGGRRGREEREGRERRRGEESGRPEGETERPHLLRQQEKGTERRGKLQTARRERPPLGIRADRTVGNWTGGEVNNRTKLVPTE